MKNFELGNNLFLNNFADIADGKIKIIFSAKSKKRVLKVRKKLEQLLKQDKTMYGINTGFGELASARISGFNLKKLQINLIRSHACGVGEPLSEKEARGLMFIRANELSRAHSGVRPLIIETLIQFINKGLIPHIPCKGSVGASGDLAPSAHMALCLIGEGKARLANSKKSEWLPTAKILKKLNIKPIELCEKEGLALINGTQAMQAVGGLALHDALKLFETTIITGAMTVEALKGTPRAFDERIHFLKPHRGQIFVASRLKKILANSAVRASHKIDDSRVQDPYSLRCMPQVLGAVRDSIEYALNVIETEMASVTDNPVIVDAVKKTNKKGSSIDVLSGGNFHGQALAFVFDFIGIAITAMGNMSERRIAQLVSDFKILTPFLTKNPGLESGFMIAHVTAAALANENKILSHPASADSIPTSANKEDFVSMGMTAALKLKEIIKNVSRITAIELMSASQGVEFHRPLKTSVFLEDAISKLRKISPAFKGDEIFSYRIERVAEAILNGYFLKRKER
ncbi:MAG: histidine ammonia-lyase [Elusimicrobia bacterium]|nr:histidine ammonia-lyase [Elusimicrobiota bacterium]